MTKILDPIKLSPWYDTNLSPKTQKMYIKALNSLKDEWTDKRLQLGQSPQIELKIPDEYFEINTMAEKICRKE